MNKTLLSLACAALVSSAAVAQVNEMYSGISYNAMSPDGKFLVANPSMAIYTLDRTTGKTVELADPDGINVYTLGLGKSVINGNTLVGCAGNDAMICVDGEVTALPQPTGTQSGMNMANAITPDGQYIVGALGFDRSSFGGDGMMCYPVLWTKQSDGSYVCEALPYPTKDFSGRTPQYVSGIDISADGTVIMAHITDFAGYYPMPLLYKKAADGTWSYSELAPELVYDADMIAALPEPPGEEPQSPNVEDYMTEEDLANYEAAMEEYNELVEQFNAGIITEYPEYPTKQNYIGDAAQQAAYLEAQAAYQEASNAYWDIYFAYDDLLAEAATGATWMQNSEKVSSNGRFVVADLQKPDPNAMNPMWADQLTYPVRFDLSQETLVADQVETSDKLSTTILNDGSMLGASPIMEYSRSAYYYAPGDKKGTPIVEYMSSRNEAAAKFITDNCTFDITIYSYDDDGNMIPEVVEDSLVTGTMFCNPEGTIFLSYFDDSYTSDATTTSVSYIIDLNEGAAVGIEGVKQNGEAAVLRREFYNLQGQRIAEPVKGVYLEKVITNEGSYAVKRVK